MRVTLEIISFGKNAQPWMLIRNTWGALNNSEDWGPTPKDMDLTLVCSGVPGVSVFIISPSDAIMQPGLRTTDPALCRLYKWEKWDLEKLNVAQGYGFLSW